ncbi:hypothetical protein IW147_003359 [Coemansia sp. RSA 720]|nr:hypothetical protein IW147_003359 [Coemansia sp. RSA 720]
MAGSMVSPLHPLRDTSSVHGAYFVFSDLSVRMEGSFRLRFDLFEIAGDNVYNRATITSSIFFVYSPKRFPGMMESTQLSRVFSEQGLRIRIRTEAGTKKRGKKATKATPSKRARQSDDDDAPLNMLQLSSAEDNAYFRYPTTSACSNLSVSSVVRGLPTARGFGDPGMLMFSNDPFSAYHENKENIPVASNHPNQIGQMVRSDLSNQLLDKPQSTKLDMDDIAAVALLDSLSNGMNRPLPTSSSTMSRLLDPSSTHPNYSSIAFSATPALASIKPAHRFSSQPTKYPDTLGLMLNVGTNTSIPFSNYRLSAVRSPEFSETLQDPVTSQSMLFGGTSRYHPALRSSSFGLQLNMNTNQASLYPPGLRPPQHQLYASPVRSSLSHSRSNPSTDENIHLGLNMPYVPASSNEISHAPLPFEQWNSVLSPIDARIHQANHTSVTQPGFAGTFV